MTLRELNLKHVSCASINFIQRLSHHCLLHVVNYFLVIVLRNVSCENLKDAV